MQLRQIEENRAKALAKRQQKVQVAPASVAEPLTADALASLEERTMGSSWYKILKPEFSKPYFRAVRALTTPKETHAATR